MSRVYNGLSYEHGIFYIQTDLFVIKKALTLLCTMILMYELETCINVDIKSNIR